MLACIGLSTPIHVASRTLRRSTAAWLAPLLLLSAPVWAGSETEASPLLLSASIGQGNVLNDGSSSTRYGVELGMRPRTRWALIPMVGAVEGDDDSRFFYGGVRREFWFRPRWALTPSFGVGYFQDGGELDLGNTLEFRSGLDLGYRFRGDVRLSVAVFHVSNGGLSEKNPGTESVVLSVSIPIRSRR